MRLSDTKQQKSEMISLLRCKLLEINEIKTVSQAELGRIFGVTRETINAAMAERSGSEQLLRSVEFYLENLRMSKRIEELEQTIRGIQSVTGPLALNDRKPDTVPSKGRVAAAEQLDENLSKYEQKTDETHPKRRSSRQS